MESKKEQKENKQRALGYAKSLVAFQEVGMGPDRNLGMVRQIVSEIISLCEDETGIKLEGYPTEFLKQEEGQENGKINK